MSLNNFATHFVYNGYFGAYPTDDEICILEQNKFDFIIKLNLDTEKNVCIYQTSIPIITYPIKDNNVPSDWQQFSGFISYLSTLIKSKKTYIHCKGGHGRSCLLVACLLYHLNDNLNARDIIEETISIHNQRINLSSRWKTIKTPFSKTQYIFLYKFLNPVCILKSYNTGYQAGFSASSQFQLEFDNQEFTNIDAAFQSYKLSPEYKKENEYAYMLKITRLKFQKYPELCQNLLVTGIKKIYDFSRYAFRCNYVGKCLMEIRNEYLIQYYLSTETVSTD